MSNVQTDPNVHPHLEGSMLWVAAFVLAMANFVAVLNMTIANVTVPNMAGALGAGGSQGTWVITSYAVAEAFTVPLTGWLSARFGGIRVFSLAFFLFGVFSLLCGLSASFGMLVAMRILQGLSGGPLMALSQSLLLRIFPREKAMAAMGIWAMTTLLAPVVGPVLGGWLCDQHSWSWVFYINVPMAVVFSWVAWKMLGRYELPLHKHPFDVVGIALLIVWVAAFQIMLDEGKNLDWFASTEICVLAVVAVIGFAAFLIWELTAEFPIVELRVFRHRGFAYGMIMLSLAFGAFFGANVLTPLWLQYNMGYTATWAGLVVALGGVLSVFFSPAAAMLATRFDDRHMIAFGVTFLGIVCLWRSFATADMTFWQIGIPLFVMGAAVPFFFVPLTGFAMGSVEEDETASASGLMNFVRTLSGAIATSLVTTTWQDKTTYAHAELAGLTDMSGEAVRGMTAGGMPSDMATGVLDYMVTDQSILLATNEMMVLIGLAFIVSSVAILMAPKAAREADPTEAGH